MNNTKKYAYISLFTSLGALTGFFLHMVLEVLYINIFILRDYPTFTLHLSWNSVLLTHVLLVILLTISGTIFGYKQGKCWYGKIYN